MNLFYTSDIIDDKAHFGEEEAHHFLAVLRKKTGDVICFTDGLGRWYEGVVTESGRYYLKTRITGCREVQVERPFHLHMAVAPTKNIDRYEWFIEKATEIGVDVITPVLCEHSERRVVKVERLKKIMLSAMKQCLGTRLPVIGKPVTFETFIQNYSSHENQDKFIAHCQDSALPHLKNLCTYGRNVVQFIGPEGDFSRNEIQLAEAAGFRSVSLGSNRLRVETAAVAACLIINLANVR